MTEGAPASPSGSDRRRELVEIIKLAAVTALWFLMTFYLAPLGDRFVPDAWKVKISLQTFRMACQIATLAVGLGASFVILARPRERLGIVIPKLKYVALAALASPVAFVVTAHLALRIAMPTLLHELATRGAGASRENAGEMGRALTQSPLLVVLLWGALLGAVGEEMLFRSALWSLIRDACSFAIRAARPAPSNAEPPGSEPPPFVQKGPLDRISIDAIAGSVATLGAAIVFGQMHAGMPGGVGLVRVVSTTILGFVCGLGRQATGTIAVPIVLHLINNVFMIGSSRGWFATSGEPILEGLPNPLVVAAGAALLVAALLGLAAAVLKAKVRPPADL